VVARAATVNYRLAVATTMMCGLAGCQVDQTAAIEPQSPESRPAAQHLVFSGALSGVVTSAATTAGGCGSFALSGGATSVPAPGTSPFPEEAVQFDARARLAADAVHITIQVDPYVGPDVYRLTAPLDPQHLPPVGSRLAFATVETATVHWASVPRTGTISMSGAGVDGLIDAELQAPDRAPRLHLTGRFTCLTGGSGS
jgi:hypothetical protein